MVIDSNTRIVLTGAPGGLGLHLVEVLAVKRPKMLLVSSPGVSLTAAKERACELGATAIELIADLREDAGVDATEQMANEHLGGVDLLINNAGIEHTALFHDLSEQRMMDIMQVNLIAAMRLTRRFVPGMLAQKRGHVLNMASLAGRVPPACQEPYAASKAGMVAFTSSLRATYRGTGVSASVLCPGFVEAGIYKRLREQTGLKAPATFGTSTPEAVARAMMRAIESDAPEVIVNSLPMRPMLALQQLCPRLYEHVVRLAGGHAFFHRVAERLKEL
jgi:short-subunit dehydrogenase